MANVTITGSGHNSTITLYMIHQGNCSFKKDTATTHSQVELMQEALTSIGHDTQGADGKFGDNTLAAVKAFQRANGLTADGYFGKNSLLKLEDEIGRHLDPDNCESQGSCGDGGDTGGDENPDYNNGDYYYGTVNVSTVNIRNSANGGDTLGRWPRNRVGIVKHYNSEWFQTFWRGNAAYVKKQYLDLGGRASDDMPERMAYIAEREIGKTNHIYYAAPETDNNGNTPMWCQYFANWLAKHAGMAASKVPNTASTPRAILWYLQNGVTFCFVNAENKAKMRQYETAANYIGVGLTNEEINFRPDKGDFVFFRFNSTDHCSHVGYVMDYNSATGKIHTVEGNKSGAVGERDIAYNASSIVGYGRLNY